MAFLKIILTSITDVEDMCNLQGFYNPWISSMMPVSEIYLSWANFIGVVFSNSPKSK